MNRDIQNKMIAIYPKNFFDIDNIDTSLISPEFIEKINKKEYSLIDSEQNSNLEINGHFYSKNIRSNIEYCETSEFEKLKKIVGNYPTNSNEFIATKDFLSSIDITDFDSYIGNYFSLYDVGSNGKQFSIFENKKMTGYVESINNNIIFMDTSSIIDMKKNNNIYQIVLLTLTDYTMKSQKIAELTGIFPKSSVNSINENEEILQSINNHRKLIVNLLSLFGLFITLALCLNVFSMMKINIDSHRAFFAVQLAVGATKIDIFAMQLIKFFAILFMSMLISIIGILIFKDLALKIFSSFVVLENGISFGQFVLIAVSVFMLVYLIIATSIFFALLRYRNAEISERMEDL